MSTKVTTVGQLEAAMARSIKAIGEVAAAAAGAVEETIDAAKQDKPTATAVTIPADGWASGSGSDAFPYYYDIPAAGATANDRASVTIAPDSAAAAAACGLCPANETMADVIRIYAASVPTAAIAAEYWVEIGKE